MKNTNKRFISNSNRYEYMKNRNVILNSYTECALCGRPVDKQRYKSPHPLSAEVDHIIPISKGGDLCSIENLQLAHRFCNLRKRDYIPVNNNYKSVKNSPLELSRDWSIWTPQTA
jgi:5-methylcytosine-specific restriction endonuclease McrA